MNKLDDTIEILRKLIAFKTISSNSNLNCINWIKSYLEELGAKCTLTSAVDGKANLFATLGPNRDGGIILSGHSDVVPVTGQNWDKDPFVMWQEDGRLYGRGSCDMKGYIAACLVSATHIDLKSLKKPMHFAFSYDEELGCLGAPIMINELIKSGLKPSICIVGEPTSMKIIQGHKGCSKYTTQFRGVEGHSSQPDLCVNALEYAIRFVAKLMDTRAKLPKMAPENSPFDPPYSTSSICGIHSGIAHNVIPNLAEVEWEMRVAQKSDRIFLRSEMERYINEVLRPEMQKKSPIADIIETVCDETDGLEPEKNGEAARILKELTGRNSLGVVSFSTEAGLFQNAGISTVICGPGSIEQAHKPNEFIELSQLEACLKMLGRLSEKLL